MVPEITLEEHRLVSEEARRTPTQAWKTALLCLGASGGFAGSAILASLGWGGAVLAVPGMAVSLTMLSILVHECAHANLFQSRTLNNIVGTAAGLLAWTPFFSYRRGHDAHHAWIGTDRDPTPSPRDGVKPNPLLDVARRLHVPVFYWSGVYLPYLLYDLRPTAEPRRVGHVLGCVLNLAVIAAIHAVLATWIGWRWLAASAAGFLGWGILYENLFTLAQHVGLAPVPAGRDRYTPREQVNFSRTVPIPLGALFFHFNLHKEHHLFPDLHYQQLPRAGELLRARRPDVYAFTDEEPGWIRRARPSHEILSPRP